MAFKNILFLLIVTVLISTKIFAQNTSPVVSNVAFSISGTTVTVTYDVTDAEQGTVTVDMKVSNNGGATWDYIYGTASGDIGANISIGTGKIITWTYSSGYAVNFKVKIIANDKTADGTSCGKVYYEGGPHNDNDGQGAYYNTIQIGNQCWLKENLNIGVMIDSSLRATDNYDINGDQIIEKYCQGNDIDTCKKYGGLYQWNEAVLYDTITPGTKGICPIGWHIPTLAEYETLKSTVIATEPYSDGRALKAIGVGLDNPTNVPPQYGSGTNTSGFSLLLGGTRHFNGYFNSFNTADSSDYAYYWSSTLSDSPDHVNGLLRPYQMSLSTMSNHITYPFGVFMRFSGFSVRCIKD